MTETSQIDQAVEGKAPRRTRRIVVSTVALIFGVATGPWLWNRVVSSSNAVSTERTEAMIQRLSGSNVRIATWNLAHGRGGKLGESNWVDQSERRDRLKAIGTAIRQFDADVVVLNEVDFDTVWSGHEDQPSLIADEGAYPYVVRQRNYDIVFPFARWRFGNVILSRLPVRDATLVAFEPKSELESMSFGNHDAVLVTLDVGGGLEFELLAVHLEVRDEAVRVLAASSIARSCRGKTVVAGDFNSSPTGFKVRNEAADGRNAIDTLIDTGKFRFFPSTDPNNGSLTFPSGVPDRCIDWIVTPKSWQLVRGEVVDSSLSDHLPVVTEWRMPDGSAN